MGGSFNVKRQFSADNESILIKNEVKSLIIMFFIILSLQKSDTDIITDNRTVHPFLCLMNGLLIGYPFISMEHVTSIRVKSFVCR